MTVVSWFSSGVSSAVASKLLIDQIDRIIYTHIDDQHPDTLRFIKDCEAWFGKSVEIIQSDYKTVEAACLGAGGRGYINGPSGAACTSRLKRMERIRWEYENADADTTYIWGMDCTESSRCDRLIGAMPNQKHLFPLVERSISKERAHQILNASGIKRPSMYDMGYPNNNCVGCVKGGRGYWLAIKRDFPEVFAARAAMERKIQASCINGVYLDELQDGSGRDLKVIVDDCGIFCELDAI